MDQDHEQLCTHLQSIVADEESLNGLEREVKDCLKAAQVLLQISLSCKVDKELGKVPST
jgi:hypothetical protein